MGVIFDDADNQELTDTFGTNCLWYESRLSPELKHGATRLDSSSIHGFRYQNPVEVQLMRTAISYHIINTEGGKIFEGGARFTIMPTKVSAGVVVPLTIYDRIFKGDVIVAKDKPIRDRDTLKRGQRDRLFAFDVLQILKVTSVSTQGAETVYTYGTDYTLKLNTVNVNAALQVDGSVLITPGANMPIISDLDIAWVANHGPAADQEYGIEFACSPNYVVWDDVAKHRGTADNKLPKTIMCVKRAFFNSTANPIDTIPSTGPILDQENPARDEHY